MPSLVVQITQPEDFIKLTSSIPKQMIELTKYTITFQTQPPAYNKTLLLELPFLTQYDIHSNHPLTAIPLPTDHLASAKFQSQDVNLQFQLAKDIEKTFTARIYEETWDFSTNTRSYKLYNNSNTNNIVITLFFNYYKTNLF
tara:strand:- start:5336 stop:5761 length:426 start_codon:yes stop_codon:yes gene_type:complete